MSLALLLATAVPAAADQLCIKAAGNTRTIRIRAAGCKPSEISIGSFDGTTLTLSGINLQIVSGTGATNGAVNGTGNLIVGYNEDGGYDRSGSHNLVVGPYHGYSSYGGLVAGENNQVNAPSASVSGGVSGIASAKNAAISGGTNNVASGESSAVSGGFANVASGNAASVTGGELNAASGTATSITGGQQNAAVTFNSAVNGGACNVAGGPADPLCSISTCVPAECWATVSGGFRNSALGSHSTVSGGLSRSTPGVDDWAAGSLFEDF
jgi:hypothetical protein